MITLKQVDEVIERTGASYSEAKATLEATNGDVLEAIIRLEKDTSGKGKAHNTTHKFNEYTDEFVAKIKELVKLGNVTKISVKKDGNEFINLPMTAGAIGAFFFPPAIITGVITAMVTGCTLEIHKEDGEIVSINEITEDSLNTLKNVIKKSKEETDNKSEKKDDLDDLDI